MFARIRQICLVLAIAASGAAGVYPAGKSASESHCGNFEFKTSLPEIQDQEQPIEATSLLGKPLRRREFVGEELSKLTANLEAARKRAAEQPNRTDNLIWVGRRLAYLWHYQDAVDVYTAGIELDPNDARLYRHRGHRYITLRQFDKAIADLEKAAELIAGTEDQIESDGQPNASGVPTSTLHTNVYYHLGLAYYLAGNYDKALDSYEKCLAAAKNNDMRVATLDWTWMTLQKLGRDDDAAKAIAEVSEDMEILENHAYHRRLLMYQGKLLPTDLLSADAAADESQDTDAALQLATYGYGVGNWYAINGEGDKARKVYKQVIAGDHWAAFGYIAAEAELKREADKGE